MTHLRRFWLLALSTYPGRLVVCAFMFLPVDQLFRHVVGTPYWLRVAAMVALFTIALVWLLPSVAEVERRLGLGHEDRP